LISKLPVNYPERAFQAAKAIVPRASADIPPNEASFVDQLIPGNRVRFLVVPAECIEHWLGDDFPDRTIVAEQIRDSVQAVLRDFWIAHWRHNTRLKERKSPSIIGQLLMSIDSNARGLAVSLAQIASAAREQSEHGRSIRLLLDGCTEAFARELGVAHEITSEFEIGALSESLQNMAAEAAWAAKHSRMIPDAKPLERPSKTLVMQLEFIWRANTGLHASASKVDGYQSPFHRFVACAIAHSNGLAASGIGRNHGVYWLEHWKPQPTPAAGTINRYLRAKSLQIVAG